MSTLDAQRQALLGRARALGGKTLAEVAAEHAVGALPESVRRHKGAVGRLIERALGVDRPNLPGPDVPELGVEIKTLPVDRAGRSLESTFVCTIHLERAAEAAWETSAVRHKLARVLWVPIEAERHVPLSARRVGSAFLWEPSPEQWRELEGDFTELMGRLGSAGPEGLTAHAGAWLQVRPKAQNRHVRTRGRDADAAPVRVPPRAFYLRASFTRALLAAAFHEATPGAAG